MGNVSPGVEKKETPSLFRKKEATPVQEEVKAPVIQDVRKTEFSEAQVQQAWTQFKEARLAKGASDTEKLVLARRIVKSGDNLKIYLESQLETSILDKFESELIQHFRKLLDNTTVILEKEVSEQETTKNLYTSRDKFEYMAQQNPALRELKERLGLDFDY